MNALDHPDHTGASANPAAPFNRVVEDQPLVCPECHEECSTDDGVRPGDPCDNVDPMVNDDGDEIPPCDGRYELQGHYR